MKPLYGTDVIWIDFEYRDNDPWPTWSCHVCGAERTGAVIKNCESCGTYPRWRYEGSFFSIVKSFIKHAIIRHLYRSIGRRKKLINKIDGDHHF